MDSFRVIDVVDHIGKGTDAPHQGQHHPGAAQHGHIEQDGLDHAHHARALGAAEHHIQHHEGRRDDQLRNHPHVREQHRDDGGGGEGE